MFTLSSGAFRTKRSTGHNRTLAGQKASELHLQEYEPSLLRLQAKLSLRPGGQCLIRPGWSETLNPLLISITRA